MSTLIRYVRSYGIIGVVLAMALIAVVRAGTQPVAHAAYSYGHDNSTNPAHAHAWTHGDPNTGDEAGNGKSNSGYYYLKAFAAGSNVWCEVYTSGSWLIQLEDGNKNVLAQTTTTNAGGRAFITNAVRGNLYMCRISDIGSQPLKDYAELNSGAPGDVTTSDCGGPGPVWDPNFNAPPMEPAETPGMPLNGCANQTTVKYLASDPRSAPPAHQQSIAAGPIVGPKVTYTFTTTHAGDITAFAFFGNKGVSATLVLTDLQGNVLNGQKWGARTANPNTMNQEFVGADAGVQPAGTYRVTYTGPSNSRNIWVLVP